METPMQLLLRKIENGDFLDHPKVIGEFIKYNLLEKEKEVMCGIYDDAVAQIDTSYIGEEKYGEQYYNETFNTKEK